MTARRTLRRVSLRDLLLPFAPLMRVPRLLLTLSLPLTPSDSRDEANLDQVSDVHGHLVDLRRVVLFDVTEYADVVVLDEVDGDSLATEAT